MLSCTQWAVGSNGTVEVQYSDQGGVPVILTPADGLEGSGLCGYSSRATSPSQGTSSQSSSSSEQTRPSIFMISGILVTAMFVVGLLSSVTGL